MRIAQSNDDEANYVIARDRTCYALLNTYPYTGGHLMVVPYKQSPDLNGLTDEELADLFKLTLSLDGPRQSLSNRVSGLLADLGAHPRCEKKRAVCHEGTTK